MKKRILLVEDNPSFRYYLKESLKNFYEVDEVSTLAEFHNIFQVGKYSLFLVDIKLPDGSGVEIIEYIKKFDFEAKIVVLTAYGDIPLAIECIKKGALDFWQKPIEYHTLISKTQDILTDDNTPELEKEYVGVSNNSKQIREDIIKCAKTDINVIIVGPVGSGKKRVAELIHRYSKRNKKELLVVDFGSFNKNLIESELFGVVKGAFTGASNSREGLFKKVEGGTLVLKNLSDVDHIFQGRLLRFLDTKSFFPVGSNREVKTDVRIISLFSTEPEELVNKGLLRKDLYFRLNVFKMIILPLKDRKEDIIPISNYIVKRLGKKYSVEKREDFDEFITKILDLELKGNVRELENLIEVYLLGKDSGSLLQLKKIGLKDIVREHTKKVEREEILKTLNLVGWNKVKAARILKISYKSLLDKIKEYKIEK